MIDVLVIALAVPVVVGVVTARYRTSDRTRSGREVLLAALAPVVGGSVSHDQVLTGRYRGYDVQASLRTADPAPPDLPGGVSSERNDVEVARVRLVGAQGAQPWAVWRRLALTGTTWHFAPADGFDLLPFLGPLSRLAGAPQAAADLPDRLRAAGRKLPPSALEDWSPLRPWLEVEVERADDDDPSPDRFRAILDAAVGIAEINARANPAETASG